MNLLACCLWLSLHLGSYHDSPHYSNDNYGAGISYDVSENTRFLAGDYRNSYRETTIYAGMAYLPYGDRLKFGGFTIYATNYKQHIGFNALAGGMVEYTITPNTRLVVVGIPPVDNTGGVASFILQFKFK